jgi:hypothetical protein
VPDPAAPSSGNRVLEINDDRTDACVSVSTEETIPVSPGVGYVLSWKARTDGAHDYLISVNQYNAHGNWIPSHNIDFQRDGDGSWQSGSEPIPAEEITAQTAYLRIFIYARAWTADGSLEGRTWFDDIVLAEQGTGQNLVANGDFQLLSDQVPVQADFTSFDAAAAYALDGLGFDSFVLPLPYFASGAAYDVTPGRLLNCDWGTPEYEAAYTRVLTAITDHMAEKGWLGKAFAYWFDEPQPSAYPDVIKGMNLLHRIDPRLKRLLTVEFKPELAGSVDIWTPLITNYGQDWAKARQALGEETWWYVCTAPKAPYANNFIDHPGIEHRIRYWMAWQYCVQGDLYWDTTYWTNIDRFVPPAFQDPWNDPQSYSGATSTWGNGDGRLLYPPRDWKDGKERIEGPTPSIRLELIRDGIEDYEYFWMLKDAADQLERKHKAPGLVSKARQLLVMPPSLFTSTSSFTDDPALLDAQRTAVAKTLEKALGKLSH